MGKIARRRGCNRSQLNPKSWAPATSSHRQLATASAGDVLEEIVVTSSGGNQLRTESCSAQVICTVRSSNGLPEQTKTFGSSPSRRRAPGDPAVKRAIAGVRKPSRSGHKADFSDKVTKPPHRPTPPPRSCGVRAAWGLVSRQDEPRFGELGLPHPGESKS